MKNIMEKILQLWGRQPLFRKIYICGIAFIGSFAFLGESGEHIVSDLLMEGSGHMLSHVQNFILWSIFTFLVAFAECFVLVCFLKRVIGQFTSAIHRISDGERAVRISSDMADRNDEIGLLARAFNFMAEQKEQELLREKELLASVSHELRSPLTRLSVSVELLRREHISPDVLSRLSLETERMEMLISSILEYSRTQAGIQDFEKVDFAELVRDVVDDVRFEGSIRGCDVKEDIPKQLMLYGCDAMLRHAVENVLRNALRYTPDDGSIGVRFSLMHDRCRLTVEDEGPGVPEEKLSMIFRPFFRVDASRQRASGGTGMGLAIAEQAVKAHKGKIWAENRREGGLCVIMELPLRSGEDPL